MSWLFELTSVFLLIALVIVIVYYSRKVSKLNQRINEALLQSQQLAQQYFNTWVNQYSAQLRQQIEESLRQQYEAQLQMWKEKSEKEIRKDAVMRSINTLLGKISEEFAPLLLAEKYQVSPKDFRHLGSPVDYIAFKGLSDEGVTPEVIFIEVKSGKNTTLTERERKVRDAINSKRVRYEVVNLNDLIGEVQRKISEEIDKLQGGV